VLDRLPEEEFVLKLEVARARRRGGIVRILVQEGICALRSAHARRYGPLESARELARGGPRGTSSAGSWFLARARSRAGGDDRDTREPGLVAPRRPSRTSGRAGRAAQRAPGWRMEAPSSGAVSGGCGWLAPGGKGARAGWFGATSSGDQLVCLGDDNRYSCRDAAITISRPPPEEIRADDTRGHRRVRGLWDEGAA